MTDFFTLPEAQLATPPQRDDSVREWLKTLAKTGARKTTRPPSPLLKFENEILEAVKHNVSATIIAEGLSARLDEQITRSMVLYFVKTRKATRKRPGQGVPTGDARPRPAPRPTTPRQTTNNLIPLPAPGSANEGQPPGELAHHAGMRRANERT